jgi:ubiquinone/menaquinone biosynthesis C-methylase UbiE
LKEANRVLKPYGKLFIAEATSRIGDIKEFEKLMRNEMGF